jgi:hypothetical protein
MKKVIVVGLMAAAGSAMGQEVQSTKRAAILTPIENLYGSVEARQTSMRWEDQDGEIQTGVSNYKLIPRLGTKAFKDRLNFFVESRIVSQARTSNYQQAQSYYETTFAAYSGDVLSVTPYSYGYFAFKDKPMTNLLAVNVDASKSLDLVGGKLTIHGGMEPEVSTSTKADTTDAPVVSRDGTALVEDGKPKTKSIDNREPTTTLEYIAGIKFVPSIAPKLSLSADGYFDRSYVPTYEIKSDETGDRVEKTGYAIADVTTTDFLVAYKADALTTVQSLTRVRHDGFYAERKPYGALPYIEQRLSLIHKLF